MGTLFSVSRILIEILLSSCVTQETYHIETTLALIHIHEFYSGSMDVLTSMKSNGSTNREINKNEMPL